MLKPGQALQATLLFILALKLASIGLPVNWPWWLVTGVLWIPLVPVVFAIPMGLVAMYRARQDRPLKKFRVLAGA